MPLAPPVRVAHSEWQPPTQQRNWSARDCGDRDDRNDRNDRGIALVSSGGRHIPRSAGTCFKFLFYGADPPNGCKSCVFQHISPDQVVAEEGLVRMGSAKGDLSHNAFTAALKAVSGARLLLLLAAFASQMNHISVGAAWVALSRHVKAASQPASADGLLSTPAAVDAIVRLIDRSLTLINSAEYNEQSMTNIVNGASHVEVGHAQRELLFAATLRRYLPIIGRMPATYRVLVLHAFTKAGHAKVRRRSRPTCSPCPRAAC